MIDGVLQATPTELKQSLLGSRFETVFAPLYLSVSSFQEYKFPTPEGTVLLELPTTVAFTSIAEEGDYYEPDLVRAMSETNFSNGAFLDIGGRYGYSSKVARLCGAKEENIHSFEGSSLNSEILRRNLPKSQVVRRFVGSGSGELILDEYVDRHRLQPTAIKIDVEGAEDRVISGFEDTIAKFSPTLFIELHPQKIGKDTTDQIVNRLRQSSYDVFSANHHTGNTGFQQYAEPASTEFLIWCQQE